MGKLVQDVLINTFEDPLLIFNTNESRNIDQWTHALLNGLTTGF